VLFAWTVLLCPVEQVVSRVKLAIRKTDLSFMVRYAVKGRSI
jgi:hypothetical protein